MNVFFIFIFVILFFCIYKTNKIDILSRRIILLYIITWGLAICIAVIEYGPINYTANIMTLHVISFLLGFLFIRISRFKALDVTAHNLHVSLNKLTNNLTFKIVSLILAVYALSLLSIFFSKLSILSMAEIRGDYFELNLYGPVFNAINGAILEPLKIIAIPIFAWMLFYKRNWVAIALGIFLFSYATLGGGRFGYIKILVGIIFVVLCVFLNKQNKKLRIRQLSIILSGFIAIISIITVYRLNIESESKEEIIQSTFEQFTTYATCPILAFDYAIDNNFKDKIGGFQYGRLTFSSVEALMYSILNKVGIRFDKSLSKIVDLKHNQVLLENDEWWNALYTSVLYYYLDFGIFGVIFFPFIFGILTRLCIRNLYRTNTLSYFILLSLVFHKILRAITDYTFTSPFILIFVLILIIIGNKKSN